MPARTDVPLRRFFARSSRMARYEAEVSWARGDAAFLDNRYSRRHLWSLDGGMTLEASASPLHVPVPLSDAAAIDPEEALVASASSCHMLWFLHLAAKRGFVVERYVDRAYGEMGPDPHGRTAFTKIALRPEVEFAGTKRPTPDEIAALHEAAHDSCYIANSLKTPIVVEQP